MTFESSLYLNEVAHLRDHPEILLDLEQRNTLFISQAVMQVIPEIVRDFDSALDFIPFWKHYPPRQRGRAPTGQSIPWLEVGESVIGAYCIRAFSFQTPYVRHPGLPTGADLRFMTTDALIHLDIKVTGPNDRADEVVASPYQVSGDAIEIREDGVINSAVMIKGNRAKMWFQPELAPLYYVKGKFYPCLTLFLKAVYSVKALGHQPLDSVELLCAPNGLMAFSGLNYNANIPGLYIPGKDEMTHLKKRVRIRTIPLQHIGEWRRVRLWSSS